MLATPHMCAGAALGKVLRRPWLAWPVAFASHFVLDYIPHLDTHALFGVKQGGPTTAEATAGIIDFLLGSLVVGLLARRQPGRWVMLGGALAGILVDLIEYVPPIGPWMQRWQGAAWFVTFHHQIQHNVAPSGWPLGLSTQLIIMALAAWLCLRKKQDKFVNPPDKMDITTME